MPTPRAALDFFKSVPWLANVGHVLAGYAAILTVAFWAPTGPLVRLAWAVLLFYVLVKEYFLDLVFESGETVASSTIDALGYVAGAAVATFELWGRS